MAVTLPFSAAFTTVVLSAFISIPVWTTHSFSVSEYTNLSFAYSFASVPSTGSAKTGSGTGVGAGVGFFVGSGVLTSVSFLSSLIAPVFWLLLGVAFIFSSCN